jgi:hypothetical protein
VLLSGALVSSPRPLAACSPTLVLPCPCGAMPCFMLLALLICFPTLCGLTLPLMRSGMALVPLPSAFGYGGPWPMFLILPVAPLLVVASLPRVRSSVSS